MNSNVNKYAVYVYRVKLKKDITDKCGIGLIAALSDAAAADAGGMIIMVHTHFNDIKNTIQ